VRRLHRAETGAGARDGRCSPGLCVGHTDVVSRTVQVIPPNDYQPLTLTTTHRYPLIDYCPAGDPGHTINVSPVEPSLPGVIGLQS
jgi:hypothetical protein